MMSMTNQCWSIFLKIVIQCWHIGMNLEWTTLLFDQTWLSALAYRFFSHLLFFFPTKLISFLFSTSLFDVFKLQTPLDVDKLQKIGVRTIFCLQQNSDLEYPGVLIIYRSYILNFWNNVYLKLAMITAMTNMYHLWHPWGMICSFKHSCLTY